MQAYGGTTPSLGLRQMAVKVRFFTALKFVLPAVYFSLSDPISDRLIYCDDSSAMSLLLTLLAILSPSKISNIRLIS